MENLDLSSSSAFARISTVYESGRDSALFAQVLATDRAHVPQEDLEDLYMFTTPACKELQTLLGAALNLF